MKNKLLALALGLALVGTVAFAEVHYKQVAATATSQTIPLGGIPTITINNGGANEIYFRLFKEGEAPAAATASATAAVYLAAGATLEYPVSSYTAISIICDAAETSTVHLYLP